MTEIHVPPHGPPSQGPSREIYAAMGEENIFAMLRDFYRELEKSSLRRLFPEDMEQASRRSAAFFVGLLGGPPLYQRHYGPPRMRQRHLAFPIDAEARAVWLDRFRRTLKDADQRYGFPPEHLPGFLAFLDDFSAWMVNRNDADGSQTTR